MGIWRFGLIPLEDEGKMYGKRWIARGLVRKENNLYPTKTEERKCRG